MPLKTLEQERSRVQSPWERERGGAPATVTQFQVRIDKGLGWGRVRKENGDFPGGPVVENPQGNAGDMVSISGQGGN